jgi:uncharacterized membrane protein YraQ (UPF0718 family)
MAENKSESKRRSNMLIPTLIMAFLAVLFLFIAYSRGENQHILGVKLGLKMLIEILPLLIFALILAGVIQVLLPKELLSKWIGDEAGIKGILLGTVAGGIMPGGPYVSLPVAAGLFRAGAGIGTLVAFLTSWSLWAIARLPMEVGIIGWRFTLIRLACTFFFPPIAGIIAQLFFSGFK